MSPALFDPAAAGYDAWYETELGKVVDEVEEGLVRATFVPPGPRVLEIGCGTGLYTARLVQRGYRVSAVDASREMLSRARARLASLGLSAECIEADVGEAEPRLGRFDGILSVTAFEFIREPGPLLRRLLGHLEPGGCLVVAVIAGGSAWSARYAEIALERPASVFAHARFWTPEEILRWDVGVPCELGTALYFPPAVASRAAALEAERRREGAPGFVAGRWVRQ